MDQSSEIPRPLSRTYNPLERRFTPALMPNKYSGHQRFFRFFHDLEELSKHKLLEGAFVLGITVGVASLSFLSEPVKQITSVSAIAASAEVTPKEEHFPAVSVEAQAIDIAITKELKRFKNDEVRINRTLGWENMVKQIVADPRLNIPPKDRQFWKDRMLEIIFVESGGNPNADSGMAKGLTQLRPATAKELVEIYGIPKSGPYAYNLKNGFDNIFLGLAHQLNLSKRYGRELGLWAHHLGSGNMDQALRTYLISVLKLDVSQIDHIFASLNSNQLLLKYIEEYQITPKKLLDSPAVTGKLKEIGAFGDDTQHYWPRLKAAGLAMAIASIG